MIKYLLSAFVFLVFHSTVYAQGLYVGASYEKLEFKGTYSGDSFTEFDVVSILVGYQLNEVFAIESTIGTAVSNDEVPFDSIGGSIFNFAESELDYVAGLYINAQYQMTPRLSLFGKLGYAATSGDIGGPYEDSDPLNNDGISYGAGLNLSVSETSRVRFSYTEIDFSDPSRNTESASQLAVGYVYSF